MVDTAIFDLDGTLVDTNYQHALAWYRAFRGVGITLPVCQLHRAIGMGGDQLVEHVAGADAERRFGDALREASDEAFQPFLDEVRPFEGAEEVLTAIRERGFKIVLASSGNQADIETLLDLFGGKELVDAWTTSDDVDSSKPEPDLLSVALEKVGGTAGIMIGDATWDCIAAAKASMPVLALRTGGFGTDELIAAGAIQVFESLGELLDKIDDTPLARPT